jgi:hypothetical protein
VWGQDSWGWDWLRRGWIFVDMALRIFDVLLVGNTFLEELSLFNLKPILSSTPFFYCTVSSSV